MLKMLQEDKRLQRIPHLKPIAERLGCSMAQLALAWCVANRRMSTATLGATKKHQVRLDLMLSSPLPGGWPIPATPPSS